MKSFKLTAVPNKDPRIDDYISRAADFARPILTKVRKLIHRACPKVEETIKWSSPFYLHKGILMTTPAFKKHCALIFWKGKLLLGKEREKYRRLTSLADLPGDKFLLSYIRKAVELNEAGTKIVSRRKPKAREIAAPDDLVAALAKNKPSRATFEKLSPSHRREYIEWVTQAKRPETRLRRIKTAIEWLSAGKSLNWKYR
ncbi:MAG TPA: YdeI/OmpD-associated family protein [Verrucomicrobiae bacterium]|nr:YdeI/OmpD-associated family protein [Verrucomicrobiae bacterium]